MKNPLIWTSSICALALLTSVDQAAAREGYWVLMSSLPEYSTSYEPSSIVRSGTTAEIKVLTQLLPDNAPGPRSAIQTVKFDCAGRRYQLKETRQFDAQDHLLSVTAHNEPLKEFPARSDLHEMFLRACK